VPMSGLVRVRPHDCYWFATELTTRQGDEILIQDRTADDGTTQTS